MKKQLLVGGCSVTHGTELYNTWIHPKNVELSFSKKLADSLNCELVNVALPAASNEYIFHSVVKNLTLLSNIHSVIIVWTGTSRLCWRTGDRYYFFMGNFASSMCDLENFVMHDKHVNNCWFTGDNDYIVDKISSVHKFFVTDFFDHERELSQLQNYKLCIESICKQKNIPFISLEWRDIDLGSWTREARHPNQIEHNQIADLLLKRFYNAKHN
jgi:hypothetical protein